MRESKHAEFATVSDQIQYLANGRMFEELIRIKKEADMENELNEEVVESEASEPVKAEEVAKVVKKTKKTKAVKKDKAPSNLSKARELFNELVEAGTEVTRSEFIDVLVDKLGIAKGTASTYFWICKNK